MRQGQNATPWRTRGAAAAPMSLNRGCNGLMGPTAAPGKRGRRPPARPKCGRPRGGARRARGPGGAGR
eukprot:6392915-Lingulodinium_polyedra.AAC.1